MGHTFRILPNRVEDKLLFRTLDLMLDVAHRIDVRRDRGNAGVDEELHHFRLRAGLSADARPYIELFSCIDGRRDEFQHGRVKFVEPVGDTHVVAVNRQSVLGEVVRPKRDKVDAGLREFFDQER
jgi:hypothetical protein